MEDVRWWRWSLKEGMAGEGERLAAPVFRFVKQAHKNDLAFGPFVRGGWGAVPGGGGALKVQLVRGGDERTIKSRKGGDGNRLSINGLELMVMVMIGYVVIVIRKERPANEEESVLTSGNSLSVVQLVIDRAGAKEEEQSGGTIMIMRVLERIGGWSFQAKHVRGVGNVLADGITRWKEDEIPTSLTAEYPTVSWQGQEFRVHGTEMCLEFLHVATHLE